MPKSLKRLCRGAGRRSRLGKVKVCLVLSAPPPALRTPGTAARPSAGRGLRGGQRASEQARAADAPGRDPAARMTARGAAGRCPPTTWLGPWLLLVCLLVSRSITEEESKHCSHMIGDGHLQLLQQMIDSQMETSCKIPFQFVNENQLEDHVCYIKQAFFLAQDIMEETISFKFNTSNAIALERLQELSVRLKDCFPRVSEELDTACVQNFSESPLWALEKIKNVFNETKNLLKMNQSIFSKDCSVSFAKCSVPDVVTTPDCNCLYPKATPSSDLASASPQQPLAPAMAPLAALPWADSEGTEDSSLLPSEQPLRTEDLGSAKQRPPRSTCQTFESPETPGAEGGPVGGSPEPQPSVGAPVSGMEDVLNSMLSANWALEEASGEASEGPAPRGPEPAPSRLGGGSVQAEAVRHSNLISASPLQASAKGQPPADGTGTPWPRVGPGRPPGQARSRTAEKTDRPPVPPRDTQEPGSARPLLLRPRGLSRPSTLSAQTRLPGSLAWDSVRPLGGPQGRRSTRARRSTAGLEGGPREGAAAPHAHFNPVPLTDVDPPLPSPNPQAGELVHPLLVPIVVVLVLVLVLLAMGGLLLSRWRRRSHGDLQTADSPREQPEGSPLTQHEDRRVETPV
ncbi:macrophage colony-stimulating factor 1 isoform X1 [Eptesicus fuscus]|uniref:macrophage colony-stimulating factor 1 isoform X1 n=1 Tax=Eptesicus fuscus TaxID=29078 RepID=UPI002403F658|nr:macrophage colony-stimulating factor 1 isoform X1 [Eptesicus fuscus]XP_054567495.1 macrophage colony-stimulating factor 1 isoform X1 [Eptesicus fuscus]